MTLMSRLLDFFGVATASARLPADERLASAALLVHVANVDGRRGPDEHARLVRMVGSRLELNERQAEQVVARAQDLSDEVGDLAALVGLIGPEVSDAERRALLAGAYLIAGSDGAIGEFEDDLVWRVGRLLGLDDGAIAAVRAEAAATEDRAA